MDKQPKSVEQLNKIFVKSGYEHNCLLLQKLLHNSNNTLMSNISTKTTPTSSADNSPLTDPSPLLSPGNDRRIPLVGNKLHHTYFTTNQAPKYGNNKI